MIQSNYSSFGSGVTVQGMGFALQNRGGLFKLDPNIPGCAGRAQAAVSHHHSRVHAKGATSTSGSGLWAGCNQPLAHAQFVSNLVDYHMNIQQALEEARFTVTAKLGCQLMIESRVGKGTIDTLTGMGHMLDVRDAYTEHMGRGNVVMHNSATGVNFGASDPRADGAAVPEMPNARE